MSQAVMQRKDSAFKLQTQKKKPLRAKGFLLREST
jgi:hypothetical protein